MVVIKNIVTVLISFIYCCYSSFFFSFTLNFHRIDILKKAVFVSIDQSSAHRTGKEMLGAVVYITWFLRAGSCPYAI